MDDRLPKKGRGQRHVTVTVRHIQAYSGVDGGLNYMSAF